MKATARLPITVAVTVIVLVLMFLILGSGCSDHDAKSDLAKDAQNLDTTDVQVAVMPDGFPNVTHKCVLYDTGPPVGMYTTTDRTVILIYNDHACEGASQEKEMTVINAIPRSIVSTG